MLQRKIQNLETETQRSLVAQTVKNPPAKKKKESTCNSGDLGAFLGQEDPLEEEMAAYSSILAWEMPLTKKPGIAKSWT